jgi:hypothetical protein
MLVTGDQFILHAIGDYCLQSDWMANGKTKAHFPAFCHALTYSLPFLMLTQSPVAWLTIFGTHFLIDRYRLARYVCWAKNWLGAPEVWHKYTAAPSGEWIRGKCRNPANGDHVTQMLINPPWPECANSFGYPSDRPAWLAMWLMVACDNCLHVVINGTCIKYL